MKHINGCKWIFPQYVYWKKIAELPFVFFRNSCWISKISKGIAPTESKLILSRTGSRCASSRSMILLIDGRTEREKHRRFVDTSGTFERCQFQYSGVQFLSPNQLLQMTNVERGKEWKPQVKPARNLIKLVVIADCLPGIFFHVISSSVIEIARPFLRYLFIRERKIFDWTEKYYWYRSNTRLKFFSVFKCFYYTNEVK